MATIALVSSTASSLKVRVSGFPSGTYYIRFYIGTDESDMPFDGYIEVDSTTSYTFSGLEQNTYYAVKALPVDSDQNRLEDPTTEWFKTERSKWKWSSTVRQGAEIPYTKEGDTIVCTPLTAREWNKFVDYVVDVARDNGVTIPPDYGSGWYVTKGSEMKAEEVNYMHTLISVLPIDTDLLPPAAVSGREITAAFINGLKESINSIE